MAKETARALEDFKRELRAELRALKDVLHDVKGMKEEIEKLLKENQELKVENSRLSRRMEELEQYQRSNNLEIKGIPLDGEPVAVLEKIGEIIQEPVTEADIDVCHRVPTAKHDQTNIIVRFVRRTKRNAFLGKAKRVKISATQLGFETSSQVYINEHLTRQGKQLLGAAVQKKRDVNWKFVWTAGGKVFARKDERSPCIRIATLNDLDRMTGTE